MVTVLFICSGTGDGRVWLRLLVLDVVSVAFWMLTSIWVVEFASIVEEEKTNCVMSVEFAFV